MDLSHSSHHLTGRLAVLLLHDGDKTPVLVMLGGGGGGDQRWMGGELGGWKVFLKC